MSLDLQRVLQDWEFVPGELSVRQIEGDDGKPKVQMRIDLGMLQMELDGRPDGQQPEGYPSFFDQCRVSAEAASRDDAEMPFRLSAEDCAQLQQEALQYYHRYLALFHLGDWDRVERDTTRNLRLFDFVEEHVEDRTISEAFQQFRPYVLMMLTRARANRAIGRGDRTKAVRLIDRGIGEIEEFYQEHSRPEMLDQSQELHFLESWREEIEEDSPVSEKEILEKQLQEAIAREDYERAAQLRDSLKALDTSGATGATGAA